MKASIVDIAKKAGVSPATVSLVLNNKPNRISDETKRHVIRIAREANYSPNQIAVSLVTQRTSTIGLVMPSMENPFFWRILQGAERFAFAKGVALIICNGEERSEKYFRILDDLIRRRVDGIIIMPPNDINEGNNNDDMRKVFDSNTTPMLLVDRAVSNVFCDFIALDNHAAGVLGTEHLLLHGHTRIGLLSGPKNSYSADLRLRGFLDTMSKHGIEVSDEQIYYGDYETASGYAGGRHLLAQGVTSIFACNDFMAYGAYQCAMDMHISVPDRLSLIGIDNALGDRLPIPITTIRQPEAEMGEKACEVLLHRINNRSSNIEYEDILYLPTLISRATVTTPHKNM